MTDLATLSAAAAAPVTRVLRQLDIYEADGITPWALNVPVVDGSISVDMSRAERRSAEFTLLNEDGQFTSNPLGLWYDKVFKPFRGFELADGTNYLVQLGELIPDRISSPHFPDVTRVSCRDRAKLAQLSKFVRATEFASSSTLEAAVNAIAGAANITRRSVPVTGLTLGIAVVFEGDVSRWQALVDLVTPFGYELYFNNVGTLIMRLAVDPTTAPVSHTFGTGPEGNVATFEKSTNDSRVFNHQVVIGKTALDVPVYGEALNEEPSSPTRIARLGDRTSRYESSLVTSTGAANALAATFLRVSALESYDVSLSALVAPWLEAAEAVEWFDPDAVAGSPTRFLLTDFTIPYALGPMSGTARRVTIVG